MGWFSRVRFRNTYSGRSVQATNSPTNHQTEICRMTGIIDMINLKPFAAYRAYRRSTILFVRQSFPAVSL